MWAGFKTTLENSFKTIRYLIGARIHCIRVKNYAVSKTPRSAWTQPNAISKRIRIFFFTGNPLTSFGYDGFANSCRRLKLFTRFQPDWIRLNRDKFIFVSDDRVGVINRNAKRYDLVKIKSTES